MRASKFGWLRDANESRRGEAKSGGEGCREFPWSCRFELLALLPRCIIVCHPPLRRSRRVWILSAPSRPARPPATTPMRRVVRGHPSGRR